MLIRSIKWRLQAWHGSLLTVLVASLMTGFYAFEKNVRMGAVDNELREALMPLLPRLAPPPERRGPRGFPPPPRGGDHPPPELQADHRPRESTAAELGEFYYVAWSERGDRIASSTNAPAGVPLPVVPDPPNTTQLRTREGHRELAHVGINGNRVVIGKSIAPMLSDLRQLALTLIIIGLGIVVTGFSIGWAFVTRALRPITNISGTARAIAAGDLSRRINLAETESELGRLATVLNSTFARLETAFAQQHQFTSDAAHELRTPVSVILTQIQSTLNKERDSDEYRETLEACLRAAQRMRRLIESLLQLARFDAGQERLAREQFDLATVAHESAEMLLPLARQRDVTIVTKLAAASCEGDPGLVGQVITNVLSNALKWSPPGSEIRLTLVVRDENACLTVEDQGKGISPDDLPRVFERFYRADQARSGSAGSAGLGLSICKAITEAHGGAIEASSSPGAGATFTVRLPVAS